ncbi:serine hydroxymethyltransferase [candidate division Kazan bacterium RIFCSPHIGHO2_01_FULL_44_14]|uniref:Serine hydroxymethyltransferase n=1 Tax=candidate division Kazan bacterium RIFCSPLOWO2_01_FULL_45_19 TaxID=1798538 RepID=A0A1F4NPI0_UNCK3|nr:MAG: serine hydroxymethyltransferase [candidate division Kazan bacterium RIFCSPLOWO2_01_FULL_45_19]OGB77604.1 MAG: serine hydroxymethyltransferase [candidate division Kazan bacterium RIFCSPHIGHO2_01_FULL_44_14]
MSKTIEDLIKAEAKRQQETLSLIASENIAPAEIREATGSVLMNKYSEGYPGKRYYGGNEVVDQIETIAQNTAKKLFGAEHANVQPYSGSPANIAIYTALLKFGDTVMGMSLPHGGHLTHGHKVNFSGKAYKFIQYGVDPETGLLNYDEIETMAKIFKPKIIVCGATAYPREIDFARFGKIAKKAGGYLLADISHIAGLIAGGVHPQPFPHADIVMTTTHKTLRGPRGAIIMCKKQLAEAIDKAIFPGLQGGPHDNITAAKAICLQNASKPEFRRYALAVVANAKALAIGLRKLGFTLVTGGTNNHMILIDLTSKNITGMKAERALEKVGIITNKNMIPGDLRSPFDPSGLRLGTSVLTSRGMGEREMAEVSMMIAKVVDKPSSPAVLSAVKKEVQVLTRKFPVK